MTPLDWNQSLGCRSIEKKQIRLQENFKMVSNITECKGKREWSGVENLGKGNRFFWNGREKVSLPLCFNGLFFFFFVVGIGQSGGLASWWGKCLTVVIWRPWCWEHVLFWEWEGLWWCDGSEEGAFARLHVLAGEDVDNWVLSDGQFDLSRYFFCFFNSNLHVLQL